MNRYEVNWFDGYFEVKEIASDKELGFMNDEIFAASLQEAVLEAVTFLSPIH